MAAEATVAAMTNAVGKVAGGESFGVGLIVGGGESVGEGVGEAVGVG